MKQPTSVTGISIRKPKPPGLRSRRGFTLWELLIVVAIVGITVSMLQLSIGLGDDTRDLKRVGKDLGKMFRLLTQEAVFENRNYAISVRDDGFLVLEFAEGEWLESPDNFLRRIKLTETQRSVLLIEDLIVDTTPKTEPKPHILILSSGEMTPFEWRIEDSLTDSGIVLEGNVLGGVLMTGPEPLS